MTNDGKVTPVIMLSYLRLHCSTEEGLEIRETCSYWPRRMQIAWCELLMGAARRGTTGGLCELQEVPTSSYQDNGTSVLQLQGAEFCQPPEKLGRGLWTSDEE